MWHESEEEMMEMLKSLYRVDADYSARRLSQKYFGIVDPDYYEWETHILFDNCFEMDQSNQGEREQICNQFVKQLIPLIDKAGSNHYGKPIRVKPCKKYPTPYGGRLVWTLPGKTKIVCHLKVIFFSSIDQGHNTFFRTRIRSESRRGGLRSCTCTTSLATS